MTLPIKLNTTIDKKGWLVPYLIELDQLFYEHWILGIKTNELPDKSLPYLEFCLSLMYIEQVECNNLSSYLDCSSTNDTKVFEKLLEWLLWGFDMGVRFPDIDQETDDFWYKTITLGFFYKEPADHVWDQTRKLNLC